MDLHSRTGLSWRLSNSMVTYFCVAALEEALDKYGPPEIFNTDQSSLLTSQGFFKVLQENGIPISMDGRGCWMDNVFIERLWRSLEYENVYLNAYVTGSGARAGVGKWLKFYNSVRPHISLMDKTPGEFYRDNLQKAA